MLQGQQSSLNVIKKAEGHMGIDIKELEQNWGLYMQEVDDKPAVIRTNLALLELAPIEEYTQRIQFAVYYRTPTERGLPTEDENPTLWEVEDTLYECMETLDVIYAGVMKWNNRVNFYLYAKSAEGIEEALVKALAEKFPDYKSQLWVDEDVAWECYLELLYPDRYSLQEIANSRVLQVLISEGDDVSKERRVEHWAYFSSKESAEQFLDRVVAEGFEVFKTNVLDSEDDYPYQVGVARRDAPEDIHPVTWLLLDVAEEFGGCYDGWGCGKAEA